MSQSNRYTHKLSHLLFIVIVAILGTSAVYTVQTIYNNNERSNAQSLLFGKSHEVLSDISTLNSTLDLCSTNIENCEQEQVNLLITKLQGELSELQQLISEEKSLALLTGVLGFDLLELHFQKYQETGDLNQLNSTLRVASEKSVNTVNSFMDNYHNQAAQNSHLQLYTIAGFNLALFLALFVYFTQNSRLLSRIRAQKDQAHATFKQISSNLKSIDHEVVKARISSVETSSIEKNIYAKLLSSYEQLEEQKSQTDLYQRLYNLLGYEVRGITNTIQGGIKLLVKDSDENGALLAKEIISATWTLENLADNFNRLSNVDALNDDKNIDLYDLISELIVLTATKSKQQSKTLECFVENTIPAQLYGSQTGLFWILLLQISNKIATPTHSNALLHVGCNSSSQVDKLRITLSLYFYRDTYTQIEQLDKLNWNDAQIKDITNVELANNLLTGIKNYSAVSESLEEAEKMVINFDVNASQYAPLTNRLEGRTILLCGTDSLQLDILSQTFVNEGANVVLASTANDIFKMMKDLKPRDGIFLTDHIKGITLDSFCKTLKARLAAKEIKLMLSMSSSADLDDTYNHVDYVFYHPFTPVDFIDNIVKTLDSESEKESQSDKQFLIVEDDRVQQIILNKILSNFDFQCQGVDDGAKAVALIKEQQFDIIFMDCIMPNMDGIEATTHIRQYERDNHLPPTTIIGATALTSNKEHKRCVDAGMDYVISKPYKNDEIYSVIKKYMAIRKVG